MATQGDPLRRRCGGVVVPMVSPFTAEHRIDAPAVGRIVEHLLGAKLAGIFPLGTTGESASICLSEKLRLVEATVAAVRGRALVYAGISGNCFRESVDLAGSFRSMGADCVVAHSPSYYPLTDAAMEAYFRRLADASPLPLVLYNIPQTTHHSIALDVVDRLREHGNILALKDSGNDAGRLTELLNRTGGRGGFPVLLGCSAQFSHGLRRGGAGLIPSGAHLVPDAYQAMFQQALAGRWDEVERWQHQTDAACAAYLKGLSLAESLAKLKALLEQRGLCRRTVLPPLIELPAELPAEDPRNQTADARQPTAHASGQRS